MRALSARFPTSKAFGGENRLNRYDLGMSIVTASNNNNSAEVLRIIKEALDRKRTKFEDLLKDYPLSAALDKYLGLREGTIRSIAEKFTKKSTHENATRGSDSTICPNSNGYKTFPQGRVLRKELP